MKRIPTRIAIGLVAVICAALLAPTAQAGSGGIGTGETSSGTFERAKLRDGKAIAPDSAPRRIKRAIRFANRIRRKPYRWGGGHSGWEIDRGYDCSGAVSYALYGARALKRPLDSSGLMSWKKRGKGKWLTVYAHGGHTYVVIAGLRFDTQGGKGPRWHREKRSARGFKKRHIRGF